jgi:hypothetical protein
MKKKAKQNITVFIPVTHLLGIWSRKEFQKLPANQTFELKIDYPLSYPAHYKIRTGKNGMGLTKLLSVIGKSYQKTYDVEDATMDTDMGCGRYGIYGHDIGDLSIVGINVDYKKKTIRLDVGS